MLVTTAVVLCGRCLGPIVPNLATSHHTISIPRLFRERCAYVMYRERERERSASVLFCVQSSSSFLWAQARRSRPCFRAPVWWTTCPCAGNGKNRRLVPWGPSILTDAFCRLVLLSSKDDSWVLTIITGVGLQSFGRIALAKVYVKTEAVVNAAADAVPVPASSADEFDNGSRYDGARGGGDSGGGVRITRRRRDDSDESGQRHDSSSLLKLNGISSSIGEV